MGSIIGVSNVSFVGLSPRTYWHALCDCDHHSLQLYYKIIQNHRPQCSPFCSPCTQLLALITLAILAGYQPAVVTTTCVQNTTNTTSSFSAPYPFDRLFKTRQNAVSGDIVDTRILGGTKTMISAGRQASFFVAWGALSLFFCIIAVVVYILSMPQAESLGKLYHVLVYSELGFTIFWCVMWFIASAEWAAGQNKLGGELVLIGESVEFNQCSNVITIVTPYPIVVLQSAIAVVFGFLNVFVWFCNLWWIIKDCPFYIAWMERRSGSTQSPYQQP